MCSAGSRILVERSIYGKVLDAVVEQARRIPLGPGLDRASKTGPLVSREQLERVRGYQELGRREANRRTGSRRRYGRATSFAPCAP